MIDFFPRVMIDLAGIVVPLDEIVPTLVPVLQYFQRERRPGESLGDFCHRKGTADLGALSGRRTDAEQHGKPDETRQPRNVGPDVSI